jgi:low affinity Fe/Cu permease
MPDRKIHAVSSSFNWLANTAAEAMGSAAAFIVSTLAVALWALSGPWFHYSDTWQLIINTGTTVLTFLAVFLIQHTQNRDNRAVHLKLDELIHSNKNARDRLIDLEHCTDEEIRELSEEFAQLQKSSRYKAAVDSVTATQQEAGVSSPPTPLAGTWCPEDK